jgi:putative nucleotidyltransferase with HDIG domain
LVAEIVCRIFIFKRPWNRVPFNVAQVVVGLAFVSMVYRLSSDGNPGVLDSPRDLGALVITGVVYYMANDLLVSMVIALDQGLSVLTVWRIALRGAAWHDATMIPLGAALALLWTVAPWSLALLLVPLLILRYSVNMVREALQQTRQALVALADTIDQRDASTYRHSQRVAEYAGMIARQMGVPFDQIELIMTSARLHDLGKIGMSNDMLYKSAPLTESELAEFRRHTIIGESLVGYFPAFDSVRDIVRHHHEHHNGTGYPDGKKGDEIPLGAKILAVADAYDAMTSLRPYRPAKSKEEAVAELIAGSGSQFDSEVVAAFLTAMKLKAV